jgi:hypothetical protein
MEKMNDLRRLMKNGIWCFLFSPIVFLSAESDTAQQITLELYPKWYSQNKITIQGNIGVEKLFQKQDWVTYYVKPSVTYALDYNLALHGGLGFYYTNNKIFSNTREWRPFVGLSHFIDFTDKWALSSYFRTEERYYYTEGIDNHSRTTRLRLRFRNSYKFHPLSEANSWHKVTLDVEGFKSYDNQESMALSYDYETHVGLGIERSLGEQRKIRFELAWKYKTRARQLLDADIHTIYFKIQYYPSWGFRLGNRLHNRNIDE